MHLAIGPRLGVARRQSNPCRLDRHRAGAESRIVNTKTIVIDVVLVRVWTNELSIDDLRVARGSRTAGRRGNGGDELVAAGLRVIPSEIPIEAIPVRARRWVRRRVQHHTAGALSEIDRDAG